MELQRGQHLRIESDGRTLLHCVAGMLWVTQPRDQADIILKAGESCLLNRSGPAVVSALQGGRARLVASQLEEQARYLEPFAGLLRL